MGGGAELRPMKTVYLFERGILGWATIWGCWRRNWPNLAIAWIHKNTDCRAQTLLYFTTPFFAGLTRYWRARQFGKLLREYKGWRIVIVAHSEGTATVLESLKLNHWPQIDHLHLICGACDANFARNGLNLAILSGNIRAVTTYVAKKDFAMRLENTLLGRWFFGIRLADTPLGLSGPADVSESVRVGGSLQEVEWSTYGHSDCWTPRHFEKTMERLV